MHLSFHVSLHSRIYTAIHHLSQAPSLVSMLSNISLHQLGCSCKTWYKYTPLHLTDTLSYQHFVRPLSNRTFIPSFIFSLLAILHPPLLLPLPFPLLLLLLCPLSLQHNISLSCFLIRSGAAPPNGISLIKFTSFKTQRRPVMMLLRIERKNKFVKEGVPGFGIKRPADSREIYRIERLGWY